MIQWLWWDGVAFEPITVKMNIFYSLPPHVLFQAFGDMLRANNTLQSLNLESNFVTGAGVQALVDALRDNDTITEIKIDNQVTFTEVCEFSFGLYS